MTASSRQSAVEYYERLRRAALQGAIRTGPGLSVLISRGMVALTQLVDQLPRSNKSEEDYRTDRAQPLLLRETEVQIVQLLAAMVLGQHQEVMHVC